MIKAVWVLSLLVFISPAFASNDRALFWEVTPADKMASSATVYLLGSIHVADKSFYPLRKKIEDSYNASDHLVVEIDSNHLTQEKYKNFIKEKGEYKGSSTIAEHISAETLKNLKHQLKVLNIPMKLVEKSRPGVLVMTLSMVQVLQLGFSPELGIDIHFLNKDPSKDVIELETIEEQLDLMINMADGDLLLQETLTSMDESSALIHQLISAWKKGDESAMSTLLFVDALKEYPSFSVIYDKLFYQRNIKMVSKIKQFFTSDETYFVVVGAGHLVGDKGIVKLLAGDGYSVKQL